MCTLARILIDLISGAKSKSQRRILLLEDTGCIFCAVKRTNESRLVLHLRIRKSSDRIKRLLVVPIEPPRWDRFEAHFPEPASSARPQESRWSIAIGRRGAVVSPARWRCRQFFYYESGHERRRARTRAHTYGRDAPHAWRSCSKESSFTSDFTDRDSRWIPWTRIPFG